ncbi:MAG: penicillin-binding transpeptidase domain-containing protein [Candidatus Enterenecus sp.]
MANQEKKPRRSAGKSNRSLFRRTVFLMVCLGVLCFIPLVMQLWKLQVTEQDLWEERGANQQTKDVAVNANRGTIYDSAGNTLAMSATVYQLILSPRDVKASVNEEKYKVDGELDQAAYDQAVYEKRKLIVDGLVDLFGLDEERLWSRIEYTASAYEILAYELEEEDASAVREFISENRLSSMLYLVPTSKRYYPQATVGSHVLGFMAYSETSGNVKVGAQGIEAVYQNLLSGESGRVVTSQNAYGIEMLTGYGEYFDGREGYDLTLTLNASIQAMAEQILAEGIETYDVQKGGFCIVMDPSTGAILAMASTPDFDPNRYGSILDEDLLAEVQAAADQYGEDSDEYSAAVSAALNEQWRNRALSDTYEPGSVFKPITVSMALEEGLVSMDDHFYCGGSKVVGGFTIHCHKRTGHGDQTLTEAVENSCNVALMQIAEKIGPETFWSYLENYGLFERTGIDLLGEGTSVFWSEDSFKGPYGAASLATASFGQTFKITPVQMIRAFSAVINGGHLLTPYLVQSASDSGGNTVYYHEVEEVRQVISEETSAKLRQILESVVSEGSGRNAYMSGYRIGGKTGTSEKRDELDNDDVICSFMGFAPVDNPQVIVLLAYDSPQRSAPGSNYTPSGTYISGGNITAPMAGKLIAAILDYMGVEKQYTAEELASADVTMPRVTGYELTVAKSLLTDRGIRCRTVGTGNMVTAQVPAAGVSIPGSSNVILYLGDEAPAEEVEVPDVRGLTISAAKEKLENLGLFLRSTGVSSSVSADVTADSQSIEPGTMVSPGTVVEVRFISDVIDYGYQTD